MELIRRILVSRSAWLLVLLLGGWSLTNICVRGLARDPRFLAVPRFHGAGPAWGGPAVVEPMVRRLERLGPLNLFDPFFEDKVRHALGQVPGVASVERVWRYWPNRYGVRVTLHRPVATVHLDEGTWPVTEQGVLLPYPPYERAVSRLFEIRLGEWEAGKLSDGLATVAQLMPHYEELLPLGIRVIDVTRADDPRQGVRLYGDDNLVIRWGRPRARVAENPVRKKIAFLKEAARHLDQVRGLEYDVRYSEPKVRELTTP